MIRLTTKLARLFDRYRVNIKSDDTDVFVEDYGIVTVIEPLLFAVYESSVKSKAIATGVVDNENFEIPWCLAITPKQAIADYKYCVEIIRREGYYFELLD